MAGPRHDPAGQSAARGLGGFPRSPRSQALSRALSRRSFLRNAALTAVATPVASARSWPAARRPAARCPGTTAVGHAQAGLAEEPGHLADRRGQPADRRRPDAGEGRDAAALQLRRLHRPGGDQGVREEVRAVRREGHRLDVQRHRRGDHQDPRRQGAVRHLLPELRPDQQDGHGQADPAAQPHLHPEHRQRVADLPEPLVRPGLALHRALHRLHDRHRLADRQGARRHRPRCRTRTTSLWDPQYKGKTAVIDDWHTAMAMVPAARRHHRHQHRRRRADLDDDQRAARPTCRRRPSPRSPSRCTTTCRPGSSGMCQMWSGDVDQRAVLPAQGHQGPDVLRYWFPPDGKGMVDNDLMVVPGRRQEPGAGPPVHQPHARHEGRARRTSAPSATSRRSARSTPDKLVADGLRPGEPGDRRSCKQRVLRRRATGCSSCRPRRTRAWHQIWSEFKAGG